MHLLAPPAPQYITRLFRYAEWPEPIIHFGVGVCVCVTQHETQALAVEPIAELV